MTAEKVEKAIKQAAGALLVDVALFDVYRGAGLPADSRSLAYRLRLQAADRTLSRRRADRGAHQGRRRRRQARGNAALIQTCESGSWLGVMLVDGVGLDDLHRSRHTRGCNGGAQPGTHERLLRGLRSPYLDHDPAHRCRSPRATASRLAIT